MMVDKKRLIKAWENFRDSNPYQICDGKEFRAIKEPEYCLGQMIKDTIALIKQTESPGRKIVWKYECVMFMPRDCGDEEEDEFDYVQHCPECNNSFDSFLPSFCPECGTKLEDSEKPTTFEPMTRGELQDRKDELQSEIEMIDEIL